MADEDDDQLDDTGGAPEEAERDQVLAGTPAPAAPKMDPALVQYLQNKQDLTNAQGQANKNEMLTGLARAGATLTAGLAGSNTPVNEKPFDAMAATDQQPVTDVLNKQKADTSDLTNQKAALDISKKTGDEDPNSPQSIAARNMVKQLYPGKFTDEQLDGLSKADLSDSVMKPLELDAKIKAHSEEMAQKGADRASVNADRQDQKATKDQNSALQNVNGLLESARGNPAAAQAERDIYAAQKANTLYEQTKGNPNPEMAKLYISEIGKIAQGGSPTVDELKGLTPGVLTGPMASAWEALTGNPTPAGMQKFMSQYRDYANGVAKDAQKVIEDKYGRVIETNRARLGESNYQALKTNYVNRFKDAAGDTPTAATDHPARAAQILAERQARAGQPNVANVPNFGAPPTQQGPPSLLQPQGGQPPGFAFGGTVHTPSFQHVKIPTPVHLAKQAPIKLAAPPVEQMPAMFKPMTQAVPHFADGGTVPNQCYACGGEVYAKGGTIPGTPQFPHNDPRNDVVPIKASPGEEVLPLSVTGSKNPAMAAYLWMKNKGK